MRAVIITGLIASALCTAVPAKTIPNHAIANLVLGQEDFTSSSGPGLSSFTLLNPFSVTVDPVTGKVFVCDRLASRVLRYADQASLRNGSGAEAVFGQPRFSSGNLVDGERDFNFPGGIFLDRKGRLWVPDQGHNRVLMFEAACYRSDYPYPDRVLGQPNFTTYSAGTAQDLMDSPYSVCVDAEDRLWVADLSNHRVLRFDNVTAKNNGAAADGVLGQVDFISGTSGSGSSGLNSPTGIAVSPTGSLFVCSSAQVRILRFDHAATLGNGAGANAVLGQADFIASTFGTSSVKMKTPFGLTITPSDALWVSDPQNNRILRFDAASTLTSGAAADGVVGQPDFTSAAHNTTSRSLFEPYGIPFVDSSSNLWVPDATNRRLLRFPPDVTKPLLTVTTRPTKVVTRKKATIKGKASDTYGISKVCYRVGAGPFKPASGTTSWAFKAKLRKGKNSIRIQAIDSVGNRSSIRKIKVRRK